MAKLSDLESARNKCAHFVVLFDEAALRKTHALISSD